MTGRLGFLTRRATDDRVRRGRCEIVPSCGGGTEQPLVVWGRGPSPVETPGPQRRSGRCGTRGVAGMQASAPGRPVQPACTTHADQLARGSNGGPGQRRGPPSCTGVTTVGATCRPERRRSHALSTELDACRGSSTERTPRDPDVTPSSPAACAPLTTRPGRASCGRSSGPRRCSFRRLAVPLREEGKQPCRASSTLCSHTAVSVAHIARAQVARARSCAATTAQSSRPTPAKGSDLDPVAGFGAAGSGASP